MKRAIIILLSVMLMASFTGCQKIKDVFLKPPPAGVEHDSYPLGAYAYQTTLVVKLSPQEMFNYLKDLSWLEEVSGAGGAFRIELQDSWRGGELADVGKSLDFDIWLLGIKLPCRVITFKYKPNKELWLMVLSLDGWALFRFDFVPIPEGTRVSLDLLGFPPQTMGGILDSYQLVAAAAARADVMLAVVQSKFDPELDVKEATGKGLRGELDQTFLQGYESSIRVDASPGAVVEWMFSDLNNLNSLIPNLRFKGECIENPRMLLSDPEELICCPSTYQAGAVEIKTTVIARGGFEDDSSDFYAYNIWIAAMDTLIRARFLIAGQDAGSRVTLVFSSELPTAATPEAVDMIIGFAGIPERAEEILLNIKAGVERTEA